jgi:hypothetical protein
MGMSAHVFMCACLHLCVCYVYIFTLNLFQQIWHDGRGPPKRDFRQLSSPPPKFFGSPPPPNSYFDHFSETICSDVLMVLAGRGGSVELGERKPHLLFYVCLLPFLRYFILNFPKINSCFLKINKNMRASTVMNWIISLQCCYFIWISARSV